MSDPRPELEEMILTLLEARDPGKSICPSEAARKVFPDSWRDYMDETRSVAIELASAGKIEICQGGEPVESFDFRGPIRLRKPT
ncbi:MAG: DUF3253 domain-containing protein [Verrucomicrobiota bacterium]